MNNQSVLYGIIGLLLGVVVTWATATTAVNNNNTGMMNMMGMHTGTNSQGMMNNDDMSMGEMTANLQGKTGNASDETFLSHMIIHHQGAINMANLAKANAKHEEIKNLATGIIDAQTKEINQMRTWQVQWGYNAASSSNHSMMGN